MGGEGEHENSLEFTPTWVMAIVFAVFAIISFIVGHTYQFFRKLFRSCNNQDRPLRNNRSNTLLLLTKVFKKIFEEFALLGLMSLILYFSANRITKISISRCTIDYMLPCGLADHRKAEAERQADAHPITTFCSHKDMVPLLSVEALHQIHIFIFFLAVMHVILSFFIILLGQLRIHCLENYSRRQTVYEHRRVVTQTLVYFQVESRGCLFRLKVFVQSIFYSVTRSEYLTLKYGLCTANDNTYANRSVYFRPYMMSAHSDYFKQIAGISLYLWVFVVFYLLLNVHGWHAYFWITLIPIIPLIFVGAILKHIVTQQAIEISEDYTANNQIMPIAEDIIPEKAKAYWFNRPDFVLQLIHFIIFQTAFEMTTFVWIGITYGVDSCMMGQLSFTVSRLIIGVCTLGLCGYSTLPLYTIVTEMEGDGFNKQRIAEVIQLNRIE